MRAKVLRDGKGTIGICSPGKVANYEKYQIPVVYCDDFGHGVKNHAILPIGRRAELDTERGKLRFL